MEEIRIPDYLFVYGVLQRTNQMQATLGNVVKVRKAYGGAHVCLESHEHGEVTGGMLPVRDEDHLAELDLIEGPGYRRVFVPNEYDKLIQTYWYKDMPLNVDTSTGKPDLVLFCHGLMPIRERFVWANGTEGDL